MRVLIVEDETAVGSVFRDFVVELGHEPVLARSAEAGLARLKIDQPNAIILDIALPGMSGLEFLKLRAVRESGVPVLAVSGVGSEEKARECLRLGAFDFIGKPVDFDRLREVLTYLELHSGRWDDFFHPNRERRRARRASLSIPVRITESSGSEWDGTSLDLSPFGMKVRGPAGVRAGLTATLAFKPPDGGGPIQVKALLIRVDTNGDAYYFIDLTASDFQRLGAIAV